MSEKRKHKVLDRKAAVQCATAQKELPGVVDETAEILKDRKIMAGIRKHEVRKRHDKQVTMSMAEVRNKLGL